MAEHDTPIDRRDTTDQWLGQIVQNSRKLAARKPLPTPHNDEPSDEFLLQCIERSRGSHNGAALETQLLGHPYSLDRAAIVTEALADWRYGAQEQTALGRAVSGYARLVIGLRRQGALGLELLRSTLEPVLLAPAATAVRGGAPSTEPIFKFVHELPGYQARVHVEATHDGVDLHVDLAGAAGPLKNGRATLQRDGTIVASLRVHDGSADFPGLKPERYRLDLSVEGQTLGSLALDLFDV